MKLFPNLKRGIVLFVAPMDEDAILLPMKAFFIDYTDSHWNEAVKKVEQSIDLYEAYKHRRLTVSDLISKRICATRSVGVKSECHAVAPCFATGDLVRILSNAQKVAPTLV